MHQPLFGTPHMKSMQQEVSELGPRVLSDMDDLGGTDTWEKKLLKSKGVKFYSKDCSQLGKGNIFII